jgi:hypothetical protein
MPYNKTTSSEQPKLASSIVQAKPQLLDTSPDVIVRSSCTHDTAQPMQMLHKQIGQTKLSEAQSTGGGERMRLETCLQSTKLNESETHISELAWLIASPQPDVAPHQLGRVNLMSTAIDHTALYCHYESIQHSPGYSRIGLPEPHLISSNTLDQDDDGYYCNDNEYETDEEKEPKELPAYYNQHYSSFSEESDSATATSSLSSPASSPVIINQPNESNERAPLRICCLAYAASLEGDISMQFGDYIRIVYEREGGHAALGENMRSKQMGFVPKSHLAPLEAFIDCHKIEKRLDF